MEEARVIRNQRKSVLGRHLNTLSRLIVEEDVNGANDRLASMKLTFEELEVWHYNYLEFLEMYDDGSSDDVDKCNDWFLDVTKSYLDEVAKARQFLKQHRVTGQTERAENDARGIYENQAGSGRLSEELATHFSSPNVEIPIFSGDPREYHMFITTFDQVIGNVLSSDQAKLTRLYQYLSGEARSAVKAFAQIGGGVGYAKTRQVLKCRFGSSHLVAQCVIDDLRKGDPATKPTELRALADEVASALQTLTQLGAYGEVNTQQFMCDIVMRCHPQVCSSWRRLALENHENRNVYPTFEQFATFLDKVAREACDPVYGFDAFKITSKRVRVNLVTEFSSMKDDVVPSCISPKLGPIEKRTTDVSTMQVNHVMMDEPSDSVDKLWNIERQDETVCSWSVEDKQVHDMRFDAFKITSKRVSVNFETEFSSIKDDVVPSCISPKLGPIEKRTSDVSTMQVNHVMMDEPSDSVDKLWNIERQDETVCSWSVEDKQVHDMRMTDTGPMLKEPGVRLTETGPMLKEPGVRVTVTGPMLKEPGLRLVETGVRLSVGVELSDSDVKEVVCNILVVEEVKEYQLDKLIANCSDLYRLETDVAWMIGWGLMVEDSCGLMVEDSCGLMIEDSRGLMVGKEVRLGRDEWV